MTIKVALHHSTKYSYDKKIKLHPQVIRLRPAPHALKNISSYSLDIEPKDYFINWQQDPFSNYFARLVFPKKVDYFHIDVDLIATISPQNPFDFFLEDNVIKFPFCYSDELKKQLAPYLEFLEPDTNFLTLERDIETTISSTIDWLVHINNIVQNSFKYVLRMEPGVQSCKETLEKRSGSCRDLAFLLCELLRRYNLATRFCSGYLIQLKPDENSIKGPQGPSEDFCDLHAWTEVYLPGAGWVGLDPTSGLFASEGHIPLYCTPHPYSASPVAGEIESCDAQMQHSMTIARIHEPARTSAPYSEKEWFEINKLGNTLFSSKTKDNLKITLGGEPTFVSHEQRELPEWKLDAVGKHKENIAKELLPMLAKNYPNNGIYMFSQGKWYPGEILPRWAYSYFWRSDKDPIVNNSELFLPKKNDSVNCKLAQSVLKTISQFLGLSSDFVIPAFEDPIYHLWLNNKLPISGNVFKTNEYEKLERKRLKEILDKGLNAPSGYILPLAYHSQSDSWVSNHWCFEEDNCILKPGDSLLGYRLPLDSLPHVPNPISNYEEKNKKIGENDNLTLFAEIQDILETRVKFEEANLMSKSFPNGAIRTALTIEVKENSLILFIPPLPSPSLFLELVAVVEKAIAKHNVNIVIAGYPPQKDLRINKLSVTPDPGVLEVNIPPANDWSELYGTIKSTYIACKESDLHGDKFLLDGRKVGSGGGNHIIVGAKELKHSPFLKKPALLQSLITYWQHHPSLSYLFSSLFIGPTSQSPRIDEARHDSLYELELAFKELQSKDDIPPVLVDRILRNMLVDLTGNTHRSEISIDKLYPIDNPSLQLGLLELRGFEMPPHYQMCLVQYLLVIAIIKDLWKHPYHHKLLRWGTQLHDKFMLPYYLWQDFEKIISYLNRNNPSLQLEWFKPFYEFRFPILGTTRIDGFELEIRTALEPWPVMGEESFAGNVSRAVDSSTERVQIKITGSIKPYHIFTCNQYILPIKRTSNADEYVCGIKFKAWAPQSAFHPLSQVNKKLIFECIDTRFNRSIGGCTYYVSHPGGRNYDTIPINENEATGRMAARFEEIGHTVGNKVKPKSLQNDDELNYTLDLRASFGN